MANTNNLTTITTTTDPIAKNYTVGFVSTPTYTKNPYYEWVVDNDTFSYKKIFQTYYDNYITPTITIQKEEKMAEVKSKTVDLFDDKSEEQRLLEEYNIVDDRGCLTTIGWEVLGKLLLADRKSAIVDKLKADKESKKKPTK